MLLAQAPFGPVWADVPVQQAAATQQAHHGTAAAPTAIAHDAAALGASADADAHCDDPVCASTCMPSLPVLQVLALLDTGMQRVAAVQRPHLRAALPPDTPPPIVRG